MAFHIRDGETDKVVRELARRTGMTMTEAVKTAATRELSRMNATPELERKRNVQEAVREIQERVAARGRTGLRADKTFYDWLSDEE